MTPKPEKIIALWQATLPRCFWWWSTLTRALVDTWYLLPFPKKIAAWLPPAIFLFGFLMGAGHIGYHFSLSESRLLVAVVLGLSFLSLQLGAFWWAGCVLGDFIFFRIGYMSQVSRGLHFGPLLMGLSLIIYYSLFFFLLIRIPLTARDIAGKTLASLKLQETVRKIVDLVLQSLLTGTLVYFWNQAFPILVRPLWTWHHQLVLTAAIEPIQARGGILVWVAVAVTAVRFIFINRVQEKFHEVVERAPQHPPQPGQSWTIKLPVPARILLSAALTTFFLSGVILRWWEALILLIVLSSLYALRAGLYLKLPEVWVATANRFPILVRLLVAIGLSWKIAEKIHLALWAHSQNTFLPIVVSLSVSLLLIYLFCPTQTQKQVTEGGCDS